MKGYYVGVDGGGTKTIFTMALGNEVIASCERSSSNYHNVGIEQTRQVLTSGLDQLCEEIGIEYEHISSLCLGGAGVDTDHDVKVLKSIFYDMGYRNKVLVVNDGLIALVAANGEKKGGIIMSGTGSIGMGIKNDQLIRVGGWGHIIGDEGSAYAIARDAFRAISESVDGRGKSTKIFGAIQDTLNLKSPESLINYLYDPKRGKEDIASITPLILELYEEDEVVQEIVKNNVEALVHMARTLSKEMDEKTFKLSVSGSVLMKNDCIFNLFKTAVTHCLPSVEVKRSEKAPVYGALQMAREKL